MTTREDRKKIPVESGRSPQLTATLATVVGILVGLNTVLVSCTQGHNERIRGFNDTVRAEQTYWENLYREYLRVMGEESGGETARDKKLLALGMLARREPPAFDEFAPNFFGFYGVSESRRTAAQNGLNDMKDGLGGVLLNKATSSPQVVSTLAYQKAASDDLRSRVGQAVSRSEQQATISQVQEAPLDANAIDYATRVLAAGSPNGWDVDVFWCTGGQERELYGLASSAAQRLAGLAKTGTQIGGGVVLGRIRIRSLPETQQVPRGQFATNSNYIIHDGAAGEQAAADAVLAKLAGLGNFGRVGSYGAPTKWYISAFACSKNGTGFAPRT